MIAMRPAGVPSQKNEDFDLAKLVRLSKASENDADNPMLRLIMSNTGTIPMLLFPKPFELFSFLSSKPEDAYIYDAELEGIRLFAIHVKGHKKNIRMYVHSLDSSDIDFSFKLGELIQFLQVKKSHNIYLLLCGSCGGSAQGGVQIGQTYRVTKAMKFDRGVIVESNGQLILTIEEKASHLYSSSTNLSWGESVLCSNHIMCMDPVTLSQKLNLKEPCILCDMETYEFFSTCRLMEVSRYDCIRVVSDVFEPGTSRMKEKLIRKHVNMGGVWEDVIEVQFEEALTRVYHEFSEPEDVAKENSTYLHKRMKAKIERIRKELREGFINANNEAITANIVDHFTPEELNRARSQGQSVETPRTDSNGASPIPDREGVSPTPSAAESATDREGVSPTPSAAESATDREGVSPTPSAAESATDREGVSPTPSAVESATDREGVSPTPSAAESATDREGVSLKTD